MRVLLLLFFQSVSNNKQFLLYSFGSELILAESPDVEPHSDMNSLNPNFTIVCSCLQACANLSSILVNNLLLTLSLHLFFAFRPEIKDESVSCFTE